LLIGEVVDPTQLKRRLGSKLSLISKPQMRLAWPSHRACSPAPTRWLN